MKKAEFAKEAREEFETAIEYYNERNNGLGIDFKDEIKTSVEFIRQFPEPCCLRDDFTRRCLVKSFPYIIVYVYHTDTISIIAIAHCTRKPGFWLNRAINVSSENASEG